MAGNLDVAALRSILADGDDFAERAFEVLKAIANQVADPDSDDSVSRDLVIRALEHRSANQSLESVFSSLAAEVGLFPYADAASLPDSQLIAFEAQRPFGDLNDLVFHQDQGHVYRSLLSGSNVILSATTSFGKSLVIDAVLAGGDFTNCAVVVPTIALLDETRRRLSGLGFYKVITHASQRPGARNLFVMTQERLLEYPDLPAIDFFVIDEFYKLDLGMDPERASLLNQAFYKLLRSGGQFYLLGPGIAGVTPRGAFQATFIGTPFRTVAVDVFRVDAHAPEREVLTSLCASLDESTLVFTRSPSRARDVASWLIADGVGVPNDELDDLVAWVSATFHPNWQMTLALARGIGIHHGRLPRALAHHIVRLFNEGKLRYLICTSTLIEGVNTAAKNVVIFDNTIARRNLDLFTFNNIRGRSGRMFRHFVGNVYTFYPDPETDLPTVDMPLLSQGEDVPTDLLLQIDDEDLTPRSRERLEPYLDSPLLSPATLRANVGVDLDAQLEVARTLLDNEGDLARDLQWRGAFPTYDQLRAVCRLVWALKGPRTRTSVRSESQLTYLMNQLSQMRGNATELISRQSNIDRDPDEAVEFILEFVRAWPGHHFPKLALALQRLQEELYPPMGIRPGDYKAYASRVEHLFLPPYAAALEEYGLPAQISMRIPGLLNSATGLDEVLERLRRARLPTAGFTTFEREVLEDVRAGIGLPIDGTPRVGRNFEDR